MEFGRYRITTLFSCDSVLSLLCAPATGAPQDPLLSSIHAHHPDSRRRCTAAGRADGPAPATGVQRVHRLQCGRGHHLAAGPGGGRHHPRPGAARRSGWHGAADLGAHPHCRPAGADSDRTRRHRRPHPRP